MNRIDREIREAGEAVDKVIGRYEPQAPSDPLAPARGALVGMVVGAVLWAFAIMLGVKAYQLFGR